MKKDSKLVDASKSAPNKQTKTAKNPPAQLTPKVNYVEWEKLQEAFGIPFITGHPQERNDSPQLKPKPVIKGRVPILKSEVIKRQIIKKSKLYSKISPAASTNKNVLPPGRSDIANSNVAKYSGKEKTSKISSQRPTDSIYDYLDPFPEDSKSMMDPLAHNECNEHSNNISPTSRLAKVKSTEYSIYDKIANEDSKNQLVDVSDELPGNVTISDLGITNKKSRKKIPSKTKEVLDNNSTGNFLTQRLDCILSRKDISITKVRTPSKPKPSPVVEKPVTPSFSYDDDDDDDIEIIEEIPSSVQKKKADPNCSKPNIRQSKNFRPSKQ